MQDNFHVILNEVLEMQELESKSFPMPGLRRYDRSVRIGDPIMWDAEMAQAE